MCKHRDIYSGRRSYHQLRRRPGFLSIYTQDGISQHGAVALHIRCRIHLIGLDGIDDLEHLCFDEVREYEVHGCSIRDRGVRDSRVGIEVKLRPNEVRRTVKGQRRVEGIVANAWAGL